jgi:acyl carrier protein
MTANPTFDDVRTTLVTTLGIEDRELSFGPDSPLLGTLPELDSMAVVELITALEEQFGLDIDDADITGEVFETLGSLVAFVDTHRA